MEILVATSNMHKVEELAALFPGHTLLIPSQAGFGGWDVDEDGDTYSANALKKAFSLNALTGKPVLADDSGLSVEALGGAPGLHSARFGSAAGAKPLASADRNALLLERMRGTENRACAFVCCLALVYGPDRYITVQETCPGILLEEPRGEGGFGYDPLVYMPEFGRTVAELSPDEKNRVSHRGKAAAILRRMLA